MNRPRLALDIDGIVYKWHATFRFLAVHHFGLDLPPCDVMWDDYGADAKWLTLEQRQWVWSEGVRRGLFRYGHIYKGTAEGLFALADIADLVVVTHRPNAVGGVVVPPEARRIAILDTMEWLAFQKFPIVGIHMLAANQPKSSVPCDLYLDDSVAVIEDVLSNRPESVALLWDRPWNRSFTTPDGVSGFHRVSTWEEVVRHTKLHVDSTAETS